MTETTAAPIHQEEAPAFPSNRTCPYQIPKEYVELRDTGDALRKVTLYDGRQAWVVTKHETARQLLADPRISSNRQDDNFPATSPRFAAFRTTAPAFIGLDPPEHGHKRRMMISEFTLKRIKGMRPGVERIVNGFIDDMLAAGPTAD
ncbi:cytochrome P450, partial [Streptomyces varsoviensis]